MATLAILCSGLAFYGWRRSRIADRIAADYTARRRAQRIEWDAIVARIEKR